MTSVLRKNRADVDSLKNAYRYRLSVSSKNRYRFLIVRVVISAAAATSNMAVDEADENACKMAADDENEADIIGSVVDGLSGKSEVDVEIGFVGSGRAGNDPNAGQENDMGEQEGDNSACDGLDEADSDLPFPGFVEKAFYRMDQTTAPRSWCLKTITWPYPFWCATE